MYLEMFVGVLGGVGLFLYGMVLMGDSLEKAAGNKMKKIIEAFTKNKYIGVAVGALVTMIIQSSSATTVMVVGFVNAGIMNLVQATGVIMGANIGTTITAQLIAFNLDQVAPLIVGVAVIAWLVIRDKKTKNILEVFIGFGILFIGMGLMKDAMSGLKDIPEFVNMLVLFDGEGIISFVALILVGVVVTALVQSSSTTTGIMIAMASQGLLSIDMALPLILGTNIGTCITAILSSLSANRTAKRAAAIHLLFNVIGVIVFGIFLSKITLIFVQAVSMGDVAREIANVHTIFNITVTLFMLPFSGFLIKAAEKIIPMRKEEGGRHEVCLDARMLETPGIALAQVSREMFSMAELSVKNYDISFKALVSLDEKLIEEVEEDEKAINFMQREIEEYLVKLAQKNISAQQHDTINMLLGMTSDIERIGDHAQNIGELATYRIEKDIVFSEKAVEELTLLHGKVYKSCLLMIDAIKNNDVDIAKKLLSREVNINDMEKEFREGHMQRLNQQLCVPGSGIVFLDTISNMERVADRIKKISYIILDIDKAKVK